MFRSSLRLLWILHTLHIQQIYNSENEKEDKIIFSDVAGCNEAKFELQEVVDLAQAVIASGKSEFSAEAKYRQAQILFLQNYDILKLIPIK